MTTLARPTMTAAEIQHLTQMNRERAVAQRLDAKAPVSGTSGPTLVSTIRLKVTEVMVYERNPRHASHERITELKESIRVNGIEQIVTVTKRPNQTQYVVAKGGNTRLLAAQALYEETHAPEFLHRDFLYVEYPGEARLLAAHLRENDQRADLCFWDKANGYLALKLDLENELGRTLSLREFSKMLADDGTQISHALLGLFRFAMERLRGLGQATASLSGRDVSGRIQPRIGAITRLVQKFGHDENWIQHQVLDPELELVRTEFEHTGVLDVDRMVEAFQARCAERLDVSRVGLDSMLGLLDKVPDVGADVLLASAIQPRQSKLPRAATASRPSRGDDDVPGDVSVGEPEAGGNDHGGNGEVEIDDDNESGPSLALSISAEGSRIGSTLLTAIEAPQEKAATLRANTTLQSMENPASVSSVPPCLEPGVASDRFWQALTRFADACGLAECLRETSVLPYDFMVEPPSIGPHEAALDRQAVESAAGRRRYHGWWWLVSLSQQNSPAGVAVVPDSAFSRMIETDDTWQEACDTWIGEQLLTDRFYLMFFAILDPANAAGGLYLELLAAARAFRESHPERFAPRFWLAQGVDERVVQVG
ncbi:ParB N-terminal domain-containing protein [Paraburkholderia azotifigens]|uniref:ParB N-terminal domain-containing protein n=1 Tax=Paraburkholderia azotifigens TaxID=2057004 RepID=UPI0038B8BDE9